MFPDAKCFYSQGQTREGRKSHGPNAALNGKGLVCEQTVLFM